MLSIATVNAEENINGILLRDLCLELKDGLPYFLHSDEKQFYFAHLYQIGDEELPSKHGLLNFLIHKFCLVVNETQVQSI